MKKKIKSTPETATEINWGSIYERAASVQRALEHGWKPTQEETKNIFRARAAKFSKPVNPEDNASEIIELVVFTLAYETYAVQSSFVSEVYPLIEIVPVPRTPAFILGIINVRGRIISIVDLKHFFELPSKGITEFNKVIILHYKDKEFGILADTVLGIQTTEVNRIQHSLALLTGVRAQYLMGVTNDPIVILDGEKLLSDPKMIISDI